MNRGRRFFEEYPGEKPGRGHLKRCASCGLVVVHWKNGEANHMHRRSKLCARLAKTKR